MITNTNLLYWIWLSEKCSPDTPTFSILYHTFGSIEKIYSAERDELEQVFTLKPTQIDALCNKDTKSAESILNNCRLNNIGILPYNDEFFPSRLRTIKNPPVLLYYKGKLPIFDSEVCIGTVGTRNPSPYGCRIAYEISFDLASSGAYVISGMAFGIDSICHKAALDAGGKTVAVLGCGVDIIYPKENSELYHRLESYGTLISEYAPGFKATKYSFPQRNRLISGLSLGTLIVEAQIKSGAMITAKTTREQNRDLFAIPGNIGEYNSIGPNSLIQSGAKSVNSANDILSEYEYLYPDKIKLQKKEIPKKNPYANSNNIIIPESQKKKVKIPTQIEFEIAQENTDYSQFDSLPEDQRAICLCLTKNSPRSLEEIASKVNISISDIMSSLTILEIQGIVKAMPGGSFVLS